MKGDYLGSDDEVNWKLIFKISSSLFAAFVTSLAFGVLLYSCAKMNSSLGIKNDNMLEELLEEVVESKIGIDIDFTPSSEEEYECRQGRSKR